jgi:hypothetical protein
MSLEEEEAGQEVIDGDSRLEFSETGDEFSSETEGFVPLQLAAGVLGAESGDRIRDRQTAAAIAGMALAAGIVGRGEYWRSAERTGVNDCSGHFVPRFFEN